MPGRLAGVLACLAVEAVGDRRDLALDCRLRGPRLSAPVRRGTFSARRARRFGHRCRRTFGFGLRLATAAGPCGFRGARSTAGIRVRSRGFPGTRPPPCTRFGARAIPLGLRGTLLPLGAFGRGPSRLAGVVARARAARLGSFAALCTLTPPAWRSCHIRARIASRLGRCSLLVLACLLFGIGAGALLLLLWEAEVARRGRATMSSRRHSVRVPDGAFAPLRLVVDVRLAGLGSHTPRPLGEDLADLLGFLARCTDLAGELAELLARVADASRDIREVHLPARQLDAHH